MIDVDILGSSSSVTLSPLSMQRSSSSNFLMSSAPQVFPAFYPVPFVLRIISALRSLWVTFITDNPLTWSWQQGRRNPRADMEGKFFADLRSSCTHTHITDWHALPGPLYVINSPYRQFEPGKAVMATTEELKGMSRIPYVLACGLINSSKNQGHSL